MNHKPPGSGFRVPGSDPRLLVLSAALAILAGCQTSDKTLAPGTSQRSTVFPHRELVIGQSVQGRDIVCHVFGQTGETVLILGGIHGNEPGSEVLVSRLVPHLLEHPELHAHRRIVVVPAANPDGLAGGTRTNARGVDLNRNFPADNFNPTRRNGPRALSEPESRALHVLLIRYPPDRIISVHQPLACIDYDGPAEALAREMARIGRLPVRKLGGKPGSFGSYAGITRGIPIVTVELPKSYGRGNEELGATDYLAMLVAAITFRWSDSANP